jgi:hypothetical protein
MVLTQKQKGRPVDQNKNPDINPHIYSQLIFNRGAQKAVSSTSVAGETEYSHVKD